MGTSNWGGRREAFCPHILEVELVGFAGGFEWGIWEKEKHQTHCQEFWPEQQVQLVCHLPRQENLRKARIRGVGRRDKNFALHILNWRNMSWRNSSQERKNPNKSHYRKMLKTITSWTSLAVQWLRLPTSNARGVDSIPGWGTKILHALQHSQKKFFLTNYFLIEFLFTFLTFCAS